VKGTVQKLLKQVSVYDVCNFSKLVSVVLMKKKRLDFLFTNMARERSRRPIMMSREALRHPDTSMLSTGARGVVNMTSRDSPQQVRIADNI